MRGCLHSAARKVIDDGAGNEVIKDGVRLNKEDPRY